MSSIRTQFSDLLNKSQVDAIEWLWDQLQYTHFSKKDFEWCMDQFSLIKFCQGQQSVQPEAKG